MDTGCFKKPPLAPTSGSHPLCAAALISARRLASLSPARPARPPPAVRLPGPGPRRAGGQAAAGPEHTVPSPTRGAASGLVGNVVPRRPAPRRSPLASRTCLSL